jgi:hypothetical protein
MLVYA